MSERVSSTRLLTPLPRDFFARHTVTVARALLGCFLVRELPGGRIVVRITETEAYRQHERGAHAYKGRTPRTEPLFGAPGHAYVYLIYGMYWCLNAVTEREGYGAAVLIRGAEIVEGEALVRKNITEWRRKRGKTKTATAARLDGPGKLCLALYVTKEQNQIDLVNKQSGLWIAQGTRPKKILTSERIGIAYAGEDARRLWRFESSA